MSKLRVMLADLKYFNKYSLYDVYVPLNLGYLVTYARKALGGSVDISIHLDAEIFVDECLSIRPDVIGFSIYTWNLLLTTAVIKKLRERLGDKICIVVGGPTVGDDEKSQTELFARLPGVDALIPGEGEIGLLNLIKSIIGTGLLDKGTPISNVVLWDGDLVYAKGVKRELLALDALDSPYLTGVLDDFLQPPFRPMIQTTRGCPYTCTFCVLGSNTATLRKVSTSVVQEELKYLAKHFSSRAHSYLFVVDDNFGIFKEDIRIAESIYQCYQEHGYPLRVGFYVNKQITPITKEVSLILKDIQGCYCISLQTDNPETLKLIKRKNVPDAQMHETIAWLKSNGLIPMTELIFGLPHDTKESYVSLLEKTVHYGFEIISTNPLILLDGAEVNRHDQREKFGLKTKYRLFMNYYGYADGVFTCEAEEVVTGSNSFTFDDFLSVRYLAFMFYAVYMLRFNFLFFNELILSRIKITDFFESFFLPDRSQVWPERYLLFLSDLKNAFISELYDSKEDLIKATEEAYIKNGCNPLPPTKINVLFSARLIFGEGDWQSEVLTRILNQHLTKTAHAGTDRYSLLLRLYEKQLINPIQPTQSPTPLVADYDLLRWMNSARTESLEQFRADKEMTFSFHLTESQEKLFFSAFNAIAGLEGIDSYYALVENLGRHLYYSVGHVESRRLDSTEDTRNW